ncbi:type I-D CRISPR-associated protein Cas10d/Csc3 [Haloarcula sp. Atlit-120R]|uniref:type I-D CRISPR-associated protein Cas10d/Csc3 n=1 Tax=Haloarcula sp. Atlit-120R TaxID=2282135 RepID=UPI000EF1AEE2|nr:type I-D CRISPR-associated protein Cas10d/Csc3 [Haloarcula sp. Atlit-120R]RLM32780.1 type I-D CRISPR-associated protein Cas10d/Csc3 [Haloarcula sp. Atlit-120R]
MTDNDRKQATLDEIGSEGDGESEEVPTEGVDSFSQSLFKDPEKEFGVDPDPETVESKLDSILSEYISEIDPRLVEAGWSFLPNKSVEYSKVDQSMLNHTRNLVYFLHQLARQVENTDLPPITPEKLRHLVALAVAHDYHKLRKEDENPDERFDIKIKELEPFIKQIGLDEFSASQDDPDSALSMRTFRSCAVDHHETDNANSTRVTTTWREYRPLIRLADAMASSTTPEAATNTRVQDRFREAFPSGNVELAYHQTDHVSGIFTNLLNKAVSEYLQEEYNYHLLTMYQDGCVYLAPSDQDQPETDEDIVAAITSQLGNSIGDSHPSYNDVDQLRSNFSIVGAQGLYSLNEPDFFYAGSGTMLQAVVRKGITDGDADSSATDPATESMELLEDELGAEFEKTEQQYGLGRFVNTIKSWFVDPLLPSDRTANDLIRATVTAFGFSDELSEELVALSEDTTSELTSGGKWEYSYAIAQALLDRHGTGPVIPTVEDEIVTTLSDGLAGLVDDDTDWRTLIQNAHAGDMSAEVEAFIGENLRVGGGNLILTSATVDTYDEYVKSSRGKTCMLCSRGVAAGGNLGLMKSKQSLTTLQGGFSNREMVGGMKRDNLLLCSTCRIEFSLRETAASQRDEGRLFFHLVPDYFYTPYSWRLYSRLVNRFTGENRVRLGRLAERVFDIDSLEEFTGVMDELTQPEGNGRTMIESLSQQFDRNQQFGAQTVGYFKNPDNDTEFQFFGAFLALTVSAYTGMRVYLSSSPVPEMRSRDFPEFAKIGSGFTQVTRFYGETVPLTSLRSVLQSAAAVVKLGYAIQGNDRNDSLFAKYLRTTRNELLPGSYLLKRAVQTSDEGPYILALMRYAVALDQRNAIRQSNSQMSDTPHNRITTLADLAYDAIRPASGHDRKPHRVERVFRESVKAVSKTGQQLDREDYRMCVSGRLQKMIDRQAGDAVYPVSAEESDAGTPLQERIEEYARYFVDEILYGIADGRPSQLKRLENNLADGFFGATLRAEAEYYKEDSAEKKSADQV